MKNNIVIRGKIAIIALTGKHGGRAVIDAEDIAKVEAHGPWHIGTNGQVVAKITGTNGLKILLHRLVMDATRADIVRHVNGSPLDCRKENLSLQQGARSSSQPKGVFFDTNRKKWRAYHHVDGKRVYLGRFDTEAEALAARREATKDNVVNIYMARGRWRAYAGPKYLGVFDSKEDALEAQKRYLDQA